MTGYVVEADLTRCGAFTVIWDGRDRPEILKFTLPSIVTGEQYTFRHTAINFNGQSEYSDEVVLYACVNPVAPSEPKWVTSTQTSITIQWEQTTDDGGCPIIDYRVFRDSGLGLGESDIIYEIHADQLQDKTHITQLEVTDFPVNSVGNHFAFIVKAYTQYAVDGVSSTASGLIVLASVPD